MLRLKTLIAPGLALALALTLGVGTASADIQIYDLTTFNVAGYTGPYVQLEVNRTSSTTADITFTSLTNSGNIYLMGAQGAVAVNVNATSWTLGTITGSNAGTGFSPGPWTDGGSGNEDGWGTFNQTINSFGAFTHSSDTISFSLTNTSGTWASATSVLLDNGTTGGGIAAAHILVTSSPADASNTALATGYASGAQVHHPPNPIPEPSTMLIAAVGAIGFVGFGVRRRKKS